MLGDPRVVWFVLAEAVGGSSGIALHILSCVGQVTILNDHQIHGGSLVN